MEKQITVKDKKEVKHGVSESNRPWTLHAIVDQDNVRYSTFNGEMYNVGQSYLIEYKEEQKGQYTNRTILPPKKEKFAKPVATQNAEKIIELLKHIAIMSEECHQMLKMLVPNAKKDNKDINNTPF